MSEIASRIQDICDESHEVDGVDWGVQVVLLPDDSGKQSRIVEINADHEFYAASVAKIPIAAGAIIGRSWLKLPSRLEEEHIVPGSGILKYFPPGYELRLGEAAGLMLIASDNTAAKMIVRDPEGLEDINAFLERKHLQVTRLNETTRDGGSFRFDYGFTTAEETAKLMKAILKSNLTPWIIERMAQSHNPWGVRRSIEANPYSIAKEITLDGVARVAGKLRNDRGRDLVLRHILNGPKSIVSVKEGDLEGKSMGWHHEVAVFECGDADLVLVALSKSPSTQLSRASHPAVIALSKMGKVIHDTTAKGI